MSTTDIIHVRPPASFESAMTTVELAPAAVTRPSAVEWYPRLHVGWNYAACVDVFCYFDDTKRGIEIQWAIHPFGSPFRGKPDLFGFDPTPRFININCGEDLRNELKKAVVNTLLERYLSQEKFSEDTPVYEGDEDIETLELWEKNTLDISKQENVEKIHKALKEKFGLDLDAERIKLLSNLGRFSSSVFNLHAWEKILCEESRPAVPLPTIVSLKRKTRYSTEETPEQPLSKKATTTNAQDSPSTSSGILQKNLIISKWLRQELDSVEPHLRTIQEFLKTSYRIEEEEASLEKIKKMTDMAVPSESPLSSRIFRGLSAAAWPEMIPSLVRPVASRSRTFSFQGQTPLAKRISSIKMEDANT